MIVKLKVFSPLLCPKCGAMLESHYADDGHSLIHPMTPACCEYEAMRFKRPDIEVEAEVVEVTNAERK